MLRHEAPRARGIADAVIVIVIACALALPSLLWLLQDALGSAVAQRSGGVVVLFLKEGRAAKADSLERELRQTGPIADWEYLDAEQARNAFAGYLGIGDNATAMAELAVPATVTLRLQADVEPDAGDALVSQWRQREDITDVWWNRDDLQRSQVLYRTLRRLGYLLTLVLLGAGIAIIGGSVAGRMARERPAITVMTLLGASNFFIMRPYVVHALLLGVIAAALGALLVSLGVSALEPTLLSLESVLGAPIAAPQPGSGTLSVIFTGAPLIAAGTTFEVVRRQLTAMRSSPS